MKDLESLVAEICRISVDVGRFRMSWVGLLDPGVGYLPPVAHAGHDDGFLALAGISDGADANGRDPSDTALREGRH